MPKPSRRKRNVGGQMAQKGMGIPAYYFSHAIEYGSQEKLYDPYKNSVWVQAAIKKVAGPVASVQPCFYRPNQEVAGLKSRRIAAPMVRTGLGSVKRIRAYRTAKEQEIDVPGMQSFLRSPMAGLGYSDFVQASIGWNKLAGETFWILDDSALVKVPYPEVGRKLQQVIVARPDRMRHVIENGKLVGWEFRDSAHKAHTLLPEQVIQTKEWNPYNEWRGLGEYEAALIAAESDFMAGKFNRNLMANNGDTGPYIIAKNGVPTGAQREQLLADLRSKREATLRGQFRPIFLTGDISVEDPQIKAVDEAFISGRLENRHEIAIAFGVPPSVFDIKASYSIGSASDFYQLILNTCIPAGEKYADALERLTLMLTGVEVEILLDWDEHPVMQEVRKERIASADGLFDKGMPMKDVSDYLRLDLPRFDGDDVGYLPINLTTVSEAMQPAPDPTKDPSYSESTDPAPKEDAALKMIREAFQKKNCGLQISNCELEHKNPESKKLWESHMRQRLPAVRMYQKKVSRVLNEYRAKALHALEAAKKNWSVKTNDAATKLSETQFVGRVDGNVVTKSLIDLIFDRQRFGTDLVTQLDPITKLVLQSAGSEMITEIGTDDAWTMPPADVLKFVKGRENKIRGVSETVWSQLKTALDTAYTDGASTEDIAQSLRGVFNKLSKSESLRIANTETSAAYGFARHEAMTAAGIEYKSWLSSHGPHVRPAHAAAEIKYSADPIPVDEPFIVDGEELMFPGDDSGSAGNVINCQCVQIAAANPNEKEDDKS